MNRRTEDHDMTEEMTAQKATALRKPFPPESIGTLPKGGVDLSFVGHAAVTDRLLTVDPNWSWEPFSVGPDGLPALDRSNNLWIRLTVCGVTRIGVGDGKSAKECIGDAIRNAAMRFGVALDLWAKENLVEFAQAAQRGEAVPESPPIASPLLPDDQIPAEHDSGGHVIDVANGPMKPKTRGHMFVLFDKLKITDEDEQRAGISKVVGREVRSRGSLTEGEAQMVVKSLEARTGAREEQPA